MKGEMPVIFTRNMWSAAHQGYSLHINAFLNKSLLWLALLLLSFGWQNVSHATASPPISLTDWQYRWGDSPFTHQYAEWTIADTMDDSQWQAIAFPSNPPKRQGQQNIWFRTVLPSVTLTDPVIFISSIDLIAEVYLRPQKIYSFGEFDRHGQGDFQGWPWHMISLPADYMGQPLFFRIYSDYTDIGLWGEITLLERSDALLNILNNSHGDLLISAFFAFIALLALAFAVMWQGNRQFIYLGLFSLASAGNLLGESQALQLLVYAPLAKSWLAAISYFSIPVFIALILRYWLIEQAGRIMLRIAQLHIIYVILVIVLSIFGVARLAFFYPVFDALFVLSLLTTLWICIRYFAVMSIEQRWVMAAFGVYALFFLIDMIVAHGLVPWFDFQLAYGGLFFALVLVLISLWHYRQTQTQLREWNMVLESRVNERTAMLQGYVQLEQQRTEGLALMNEFSLRLDNLINRLQRCHNLNEAGRIVCAELPDLMAPAVIQVTLSDEQKSPAADLLPGACYLIEIDDLQQQKQPFISLQIVDLKAETDEVNQLMAQFIARAVDRLSVTLSSIKLRDELRVLSFEDALTGLKNRRFFDQALQRELQMAQRQQQAISLLICDIDHFKQFNDRFGHEAGDMALRAVASLMMEHFRETDIPCRYGGEEFVILMPAASLSEALERARQLLRKVAAKNIQYKGKDLGRLTISIGISSWDGNGSLPEIFLQDADKALYRAKQAGRNQVQTSATHRDR